MYVLIGLPIFQSQMDMRFILTNIFLLKSPTKDSYVHRNIDVRFYILSLLYVSIKATIYMCVYVHHNIILINENYLVTVLNAKYFRKIIEYIQLTIQTKLIHPAK